MRTQSGCFSEAFEVWSWTARMVLNRRRVFVHAVNHLLLNDPESGGWAGCHFRLMTPGVSSLNAEKETS